jgi:hypothetical protein
MIINIHAYESINLLCIRITEATPEPRKNSRPASQQRNAK